MVQGRWWSDAHYEEVRMANIQRSRRSDSTYYALLEEEGVLVYRSRERLENEIGQFAVIERDGMISSLCRTLPYSYHRQ